MTWFLIATALMLRDLLRFIAVNPGRKGLDLASHALEGLVSARNSLAMVLPGFHWSFGSLGFAFQKANFGRWFSGSSTS
jgi:hypothetical protein